MKISKPQIIQENQQIIYRVAVESIQGSETLWYSLHESFANLVSDSCDAPLVGLLIPAMANGEDIYINGMISERLLYNLSGPFQSLLQKIIPSLRRVKIYPDDVCHDKAGRAPGVATGFSGGIDSYSVLEDHYYSNISDRFKVTHLLFNNVGSHGTGGERLFLERYKRLLPATERLGLQFLMTNSNLGSFYSKKLNFQQTHTLRNTSVALLLQSGIGRYMYASAYNYSDVFVGPTHSMAYIDTITLPLLSTDNLDAFSVGSEYTRVEKTLQVAEVPDSYRFLDVCVNARNTSGYTNCSMCWKCLRTLVTLDIAGNLESYSSSFDLDIYKNQRGKYITTLIESDDPLLREIVQFAKERNYSLLASPSDIQPSDNFLMTGRVMDKVNRLMNKVGL